MRKIERGLSVNRRVVARASRPCEHADQHTGETPVPLLRYAGSSSQCMREGETGLSMNVVTADASPAVVICLSAVCAIHAH